MAAASNREGGRLVGRYAIYGEIAAGGMATVHYGRLFGNAGFSRGVAIKRLHPQFAKDPEFVAMFLDEAHVAARIRHPNVVPTLDVVATDGELFLVMEYVQGETLARLLRPADASAAAALPPRVAAAVVSGVLHGLHAAHEATNADGEKLGIVHRDVSPQNVLVGVDGVARVLDFGIAKARDCIHITRGGLVKGKVAYMAPEQLVGDAVDRRADVYATGVLLWEALVGRRLFQANGELATAEKVKANVVDPPSRYVRGLPPGCDELVMRAVAKHPDERFATAREMAAAVEACLGIAGPAEVGAWVEGRARSALEVRARHMAAIERSPERSEAGAAEATAGVDPTTAPGAMVVDAPTGDVDPDGVAPTMALEHVISVPSSGTQLSMAHSSGAGPRARRMWPRLVAGGGAAALVVCSVLLAWTWRHSTPSAAVTAAAASPAVVPVAEPSTAASIDPAAVPVNDLPEAADTTAAPAADIAPRPAATTKSHATPAPHPPSPRRTCNPPYVLDSHGIRHLKPECL